MLLMLQDKEVLYFNLEDFVIEVLNESLLPFSIRSAFKCSRDMKSILYNIQLLKSYLSSRVLSLSRDNAKVIYTAFCIPQRDDLETRVKICLACKGVSIQDSYWLKGDNASTRFSDVNVRKNKFKEIVEISLNGVSPTVSTPYLNPELTTHGLFRKAWTRIDDDLYLLKSDKHNENINTRMEVLASKMLSCFSNKIDCVEYTGRFRNTTQGKIFVDKCKNFVGESHSFVEAWELIEYCDRARVSFKERVLGYSPEVASIGVLDFILSNTDRHTQNYGFLMNNVTGQIDYIAPLFDFNCALVADVYNRDASDTLSQMFNDGSTLRQIAELYNPYSRLVLDLNRFENLRKSNKEFNYVFDKVLGRCEYLGII